MASHPSTPDERMTAPEVADYIVDIPEEVVAAIAKAAVEAYKRAEREHKRAYHRAYDQARRSLMEKRKAEIEGGLKS